MKRIICILFAILIIAGITAHAKTTKKAGNKKSTNSSIVVTKGETKQYGDFLTTQFYTVSKGKNKKITLEFPISGNEKLVKSVREDLLNKLNIEGNKNTKSLESLLKTADLSDLCTDPSSFEHKHFIRYDNGQIISYADYCGNTLIGGNSFLIEDGTSLNEAIEADMKKLEPYMLREMPDYWTESNYGSFFIIDQKLYFRAFYDIVSPFNTIEIKTLNIPAIYNIVSPEIQQFFKLSNN